MQSILVLSFIAVGLSSTSVAVPSELYSPLIPQKIQAVFNKSNTNPIRYPQYTDTSGIWQYFSPNMWPSGFFPATLYGLNERNALCPSTPADGLGMVDWLELGRSATGNLVPPEPENTADHDRAFLISFLEELAINPGNTTAQAIIVDFAKILADRFNPAVGCTRSSDGSDPFKVIIDVMMNLEPSIIAANLTGNTTFYEMAVSHADTTMRNHIRDDGGSIWQMVEYNSTTGEVIGKRTIQGYSDNSAWTRGQAWGIYGFANMFKLTGEKKYLKTARRLADYFINRLPGDGIVPWDFDAPLLPAPRAADSSAACIAAAALLLLARYEIDKANMDNYTNSAIQVRYAITSLAWAPSWESLLSNATVNKPAGNALTGSIYGDYYFIKVGNELISRKLVECFGCH
ncbi:Unsaturated glucuronyl hydrolase [Termitomyces sp. J132]|nr:Unsaturated glucuronyl hydrolase [Termitomyces sp. J132]